eukprot:5136829-Alexandrium_andersonii.AAC.1
MQCTLFIVCGDPYIAECIAFAVCEPGIAKGDASPELDCVISLDLLLMELRRDDPDLTVKHVLGALS